ncbi:hypothetical protein HMPREF9318_00239 [Streptococcus urinalis FB127-CNA-2]|uniref:Transcriptional regulator, DeoR family n=1 Tax=Streptococcus urinalis 2285-97 TaxID=764291 RepID=G5KFE0_9STRE|nr:DeoR/GlpR family DNA-binding transcription regulator [Streptococcus urinalis]EHJ57242.1 transcriptional regulator, DeoR family [Streptococcus urinalis 2285-97]EKS22041.1 hypothetical protein HMPREF9318_00239 [Streptococcus urinalis FB127-CNA-2]VEF31853.1 DeoR family regulatory protein [Streptococcus urinalis]
MPILKSKRKQLILDKIKEENYVSLEELIKLLETSESTIRRDLDELEEEHKLYRVHGGAELHHSLQEELSIEQKSVKNSQEKNKIALTASTLIDSGDVIFIDAGTTTAFLLDYLKGKNIKVVTNSIHHAAQLVDSGVETIIIGGLVKQITDASIGHTALQQINDFNFDKAFIGMNGIDEHYLTTPDVEEAYLKRAVITNAKETFVLSDASKLGQISFVNVAKVDKVSLIIEASDHLLLKKLKKKMKVIEI